VLDSDDEVGDYKLRDDNYGDRKETKGLYLIKVETSFFDTLKPAVDAFY